MSRRSKTWGEGLLDSFWIFHLAPQRPGSKKGFGYCFRGLGYRLLMKASCEPDSSIPTGALFEQRTCSPKWSTIKTIVFASYGKSYNIVPVPLAWDLFLKAKGTFKASTTSVQTYLNWTSIRHGLNSPDTRKWPPKPSLQFRVVKFKVTGCRV